MLNKKLRKMVAKKIPTKKQENTNSRINQRLFYSSMSEGNFEQSGKLMINYSLNTKDNVCLRDHLVDNKYCFPTDAYLELVYVACQTYFGFDSIVMENVIISSPIIVELDDTLNVRLYFVRYDDGLRFKLVSKDNVHATEKIHIRGEVVKCFEHESGDNISLFLNENIVKKFNVSSFYKREASIFLGKFYRSLQSLDFYGDYAIGRMSNSHHDNRFSLNPSILNAALGCAISYSSYRVGECFSIGSDYFLPYKINGLKLFNSLSEKSYYCLIKIIQNKKDWIECSLQVFNEGGELSLVVANLRLQRIACNKALNELDKNKINLEYDTKDKYVSLDNKVIDETLSQDVAVIGMSCRFPKSNNLDEFWDVLTNAQDCIDEVPVGRWLEFKGWYHPDPEHEGTASSKYAGFIDDYDCFDPLFFNISPTEAELMDPQQKIFLEQSWSAIENAGYAPNSLTNEKCGVYVGCTSGDYSHVLSKTGNDKDAQSFTGTSSSILAARISYLLNLKGASLAVDTACSSSLTAIHLAAESIRQGDNNIAIAGGVNIFSTPLAQILTSQVGMQSNDGRCHTFDKDANGTVFSEGCGVLLLKSLSTAIKDGDSILGVIRGTGINQDGKTNGITAPSALSQDRLFTQIYNKYHINPEKINYVEAHGTGTVLGDPIEIQGLNGAFRKFTEKKEFCAIGSVKSNIGHASYAAGVAGLIKILLCIQHKQLVASIHYNTSNKHINFNESPFYVNRENSFWQVSGDNKRMAAVSSFGFSGSNAHVVIEEYIPVARKSDIDHEFFIVPLSAKSDISLNRLISNLHSFLNEPSKVSANINIANIAYTLQVGRNVMEYRVIFVVKNVSELVEKLNLFLDNDTKKYINNTVFVGENKSGKKCHSLVEQQKNTIKNWFYNKETSKISEYWISGNDIDWTLLYGDIVPNRISLPTYPFTRERFWATVRKPLDPECEQGMSLGIIESKKDTTNKEELLVCVSGNEHIIHDKIEFVLKKLIHQFLKIPLGQLDVNSNFSVFGFDSINLVKYTRLASKHFGFTITPAKLFANSTISTLADCLQHEYTDEINVFYGVDVSTSCESLIESQCTQVPSETIQSDLTLSNDINENAKFKHRTIFNKDEPIAIIGISGKFPKSENLDIYWKNLQQGKDCISEIPSERWKWKDYYSQAPIDENKTNVIWGGFLDGIQEFDPNFFGISPQEAEQMDPQQRLLMTHTYKAIEDAGYKPKVFSEITTGVFTGIGNDGYNGIVENSGKLLDGHFATGTLPSIGPNRISYFFDLHGPSEPIETACASSLVAIHRAITEINNGTCEVAIVGGVNTVITPYGHIAFSKSGLLSEDGRCKPFSSEADGFVRAEGIGVLILKRLSLAEKSNDQIYAIIRGSGVNHNGRSNFLTAPNPKAQSDLLESVYKKAGIDINTVTYLEAHGTGTELGDAVEIEGLKCAFKNLSKKQNSTRNELDSVQLNKQYCALGSVKSNIGHTELASGMASVIKVLYQIKYKKLVKSIHCETINPLFQLENSPFYVVKKNQNWKHMTDQSGTPVPLRAGVSSFGLGGVNAHVVLEEYIQNASDINIKESEQLFVLSAKNKKQLKLMVKEMHVFLTEQNEIVLANLAYTLQEGREPMKYKLAMVVNSKEDLLIGLEKYLQPDTHSSLMRYFSSSNDTSSETEFLFQGTAGKCFVQELIDNNDLERLGLFWVNGGEIDWNLVHKDKVVTRTSLPGHPFCKNNYWVTKIKSKMSSKSESKILNEQFGIYNKISNDINRIKHNRLFLKWYGNHA